MKIYVVVSFMRKIRGAMYEVQAVYEDPDKAEQEILDAAKRDEIELTKVDVRSWKGGGVIVTIHELEFGGTVDVSEPAFVLGETEMPITTAQAEADEDQARAYDLDVLRGRVRNTCIWLRDLTSGTLTASTAAVELAETVRNKLDPEKIYDDGD